ncbi:condensin complex subunit 3-like isoform X2 [Halichondria panicea]|uniref:condensin complex subunit 3-like isoform X2 n=1 Tax=Halichondria panicea TaxID=6063 RepID=UPI00312B9534
MPPSLSEEIVAVLKESQSNVHSHQRLLKTLRGLHDKHTDDLEGFFEAYFKPFSNALVVFKREAAAQRVIELTAKFAISTAQQESDHEEESDSDSEGEPEMSFFSLLLDQLLSLHEAQGKGVRFRVCQLVSRLLFLAHETSCIVGGLRLEKITQVMLDRCLDKVPAVRVQAVSALQWLQVPHPDCPVIPLLLSLLATDSSPEVRRCVLNKIEVDDRSLPAFIERTRDVKEVIRRDAFLCLAEKCSIRHFRIQQRIQLLSDGLHDDSELVQEACVNGLLRKWSLETNDGDFISLLSRLDVESSSEVAGLALRKLFDNFTTHELITSMAARLAASHERPEDWDDDHTPSDHTPSLSITLPVPPPGEVKPVLKVMRYEELGCEEVFYWSQLCLYLSEKGAELDDILPTASEFCEYLQRYVEEVLTVQEETDASLKSQFVAQQLCSMLTVLDPTDEVGRRCLANLVSHFLSTPSFPTALIPHLLSQQTKIWPQESHRVEVLIEVIADLRASFNTTLVDPTLNLTTTLLSQPASQSEPQEDTETLLRCLTISCELLRVLRPQHLIPTLRMLKDTLLIPCVQNVAPYVRDMALFCLGLLSLLDVSTARDHLLLFVQVSQVDHESVQATALKIVFDLLHVYGFEAFNIVASGESNEKADETKDSSVDGDLCEVSEASEASVESVESEDGGDKASDTMKRLLNIMVSFLEGESSLLSQVAAEGIAKLLLSRRVLSQKLLAKLLVLWYNPVLQDEGRLRAALGAFFPIFAASDRSCRECVGEVYLPVLSSVLEAPPTSPLYEIDAANMADFIMHLTQPTQPNEESVHGNLAYAVANAVLSDPTSTDVRVYTRSLSQMTFTPANQSNAGGLLELCEQMTREVTDKISLKYIDKLRECLIKSYPSHQVTPPDLSPVKETEEDRVVDETPGNMLTTPLPLKGTRRVPKPRAKTTVKKRPPPPATKAKTTLKKGGAGKRKKVVKVEESSSEESESENLEPLPPSAPPTRVTSIRMSKTAAATKLLEEEEPKQVLFSSEDSDDSLLGEHSPFVRRTSPKTDRLQSRLSSGPLTTLQYEDEL